MKQQPEEDEEFICRICTKKRAMPKAGQKSKTSTPGSSTSPTPVTTPIKQEASQMSSLAVQVAAQQLAAKGFSMSQGVAKVQSGKSSGRSSPASVSSGRSSPATVSTKGASLSTTGRKSPLPLTSGRRSPATIPLGRKSPLTLVTGRSSSAPSSPTGASGKKSPLSHLSKMTLSTLPSRALPAETTAMDKKETVPQTLQSVQKDVDVEIAAPKVSEDSTGAHSETVPQESTQSQIQPVKLAVVTSKQSTSDSQVQPSSKSEQGESLSETVDDISESSVPAGVVSEDMPAIEKPVDSPVTPTQSGTPASSAVVEGTGTDVVPTLIKETSEELQTSLQLQEMDTSQEEKPSQEVQESAPEGMDSTDSAPNADSSDSKEDVSVEDVGKASIEEEAMETETTATAPAESTVESPPEAEEEHGPAAGLGIIFQPCSRVKSTISR